MKITQKNKKLLISTAILTLLFILLALNLESPIITKTNLFFNELAEKIQNPLFTFISTLFAYVFDTLTLSILSLPIAGYLWMKKKKRVAVIFLVLMFITALSIYALKQTIENPRPINGLMPETGFSFPSGHSTIAVVFFGLLCSIITNKTKTIKTILITLPILIILSRVYLNVHWFSDVIGGALLGTLLLIIGKQVYSKDP